jgi:hypothetical protein
MSAFCTGTFSGTDTELMQTTPGILTVAGYSSAARDTNGNLTAAAVTSILTASAMPVQPPVSSLDASGLATFKAQEAAFMQSIKTEYCYYYTRYAYALDRLFTELQQTTANQTTVNNYLDKSKSLNRKLNDLTLIVSVLANRRNQDASGNTAAVNALNQQIGAYESQLNAQRDVLNRENGSTQLYKEMMRYTEEKARATNNMLSMYTFLNIFAVGMLFYVARSM